MTALSASTFFAAAVAFMNAAGSLTLPTPRVPRTAMALRFFDTHHRAHARAAGRAMQVVDDRCVEAPRLAGAPDAGDAHQRVLEATS